MSNPVNVDFVTKVVEVEVNDTQKESLAAAAAIASAGKAAEKADAAASSASSASTTATQLMAYLEDKEELTAPAVDPTLSISGAAADAKVVSGIVCGNLKQLNRERIVMTQGKAIVTSTATIDRTDLVDVPGMACAVVPCSAGDVFTITATGNGNFRSFAFIDNDGNRVAAAGSGVNLTDTEKAATQDGYLIINDSSGSASYYGQYFYKNTANKNEVVNKKHGANLFDPNAEGITEGYYIKASNGGITSNASYLVSDYIEVTPGSTYYLDNCLPTGSTTGYAFYDATKTATLSYGTMTSSVTAPAGAKYLRVTVYKNYRYTQAQIRTSSGTSYLPYTDENYILFDRIAKTYDPTQTYLKDELVSREGFIYKALVDIASPEAFDSTHWSIVTHLSDEIQRVSNEGGVQFGENYITGSGTTVSANTKVELTGHTNVAKNVIYQLCCTFSSFSQLTIGSGETSTKYASWAVIDNTNITVYRSAGGGSVVVQKVYTHGLTISKFLNVQILTDDTYHCNINLQTDGAEFNSSETASWMGNCLGTYHFTSTTDINDYKYTVIFKDANKPIYLFGDSYMSFVAQRWVYYLSNIGCLNSVLINACSGMNSAGAVQALPSLNGHPKYALWALGMNDSTDADNTTPASNWLAGYNTFIAWCTANGCTPILGTIPTIPDKNNEGKNYYIRNSGHRYIDFAKAVCPAGDGVWYTGMLGDDNTHPTEKGAIALYNRALVDFPEIASQL